jgi:hypothetical protein
MPVIGTGPSEQCGAHGTFCSFVLIGMNLKNDAKNQVLHSEIK